MTRLDSHPRGEYFIGVGRTYHFECPHCHYRANVSGGADDGWHCEVQTVACRDCRELFDVFTKVRRLEGEADQKPKFSGFFRREIPPVTLRGGWAGGKSAWCKFKPACPVESKHFVEVWSDPGRCPRCGNFLEKSGLPTRIWD